MPLPRSAASPRLSIVKQTCAVIYLLLLEFFGYRKSREGYLSYRKKSIGLLD